MDTVDGQYAATTAPRHGARRHESADRQHASTARGRRFAALLSLLAMAFGAVVASQPSASAAGPAPTQVVMFDQNGMTHRYNRYIQWDQLLGPVNWESPSDYANGRFFLRMEVTAKPSDKAVGVQMCMWRDDFDQETCSGFGVFSSTGVLWVDLGTPSTWYKKNSVNGQIWDFDRPFQFARLMLKEPETGQLLLTRRCGAACYTRGDLDEHLPIRVNATVIAVARGAELDPPASWAGCPSWWSDDCANPGPDTTEPPTTEPPTTEPPTTEPPTTEPPTTEPPATEPPATEPPTTEPPAGDGVVSVDVNGWQPAVTIVPTTSALTLSWSHPDAVRYQLRHRRVGVNRWTWTTATPDTGATLTGLRAATRYEVEVRVLSGGTWRPWVSLEPMTLSADTPTTTEPPTTEPPTTEPPTTEPPTTEPPTTEPPGPGDGIVTTDVNGFLPAVRITPSIVNGNGALTITWTHPDARRYQLRYRRSDIRKWTWTTATTTNGTTLTGLRTNTSYDVEVRILVGGTWRPWVQLNPVTPALG